MMKCVMWVSIFSAYACLAAESPNVVILYADDMGVADVSYGDSEAKIQTPHLDQLAREGMTFTDGHSSSGVCTPSRFTLLTGQHHWWRFHGIAGPFGGSHFKPDDFTLPKIFNLKEDPRQSKNRFADHLEKVEQMKSLLRRYVGGEGCAPHSK